MPPRKAVAVALASAVAAAGVDSPSPDWAQTAGSTLAYVDATTVTTLDGSSPESLPKPLQIRPQTVPQERQMSVRQGSSLRPERHWPTRSRTLCWSAGCPELGSTSCLVKAC